MADQIPDSAKLPHTTSISIYSAIEEMRAGNMQKWSGAIYDHLRNHAFLLKTLATRAAPPAMDREAVEKVTSAMLIGRSWMRHSLTCRSIVGEATDDGCRVDCSCGLADVLSSFDGAMFGLDPALFGFDPALSTLSADAMRQGEGWQPIETAVLWDVYVVTDGVNVAMSQYAESDHGDRYWAVEPEDALEWEPTHCIATPAFHSSDGGKA